MRVRALAAGLMLSAASLAPVHATAVDQSGQGGTLPHGGSYIIYRNPTVGSAAIDLWFRAPGAGYDNASPGISRLAATAVAAAPLESGKSLATFVRGLGGRLTINVYPDIVGIGIVVPAESGRRAVAALTSAYFAPAIDDNALKTAQRDLAVLGVQKRYSSDEVLHDQLFSRIFSDGSEHYPPIPGTVPEIT
jgi:predicted Zn-dependent peptidase